MVASVLTAPATRPPAMAEARCRSGGGRALPGDVYRGRRNKVPGDQLCGAIGSVDDTLLVAELSYNDADQ